MRLTIVGCSGSYPGPDSPASSYLLQHEAADATGATRTWSILLDMGNGALGALQRYVDPLALDAVLLSHLHADHCIDMTSYYVLRKYHPSGKRPPVPVWGPKGANRRLTRAYDLPRKPGMREEFEFHRYGDPVQIGPFRVEARAVDHPVPAYGLRVSAGGRTVAYSGDTGPTPTLVDIAREADLFLVEASFRSCDDNPPSLHLTGAQAGEYAAKARVKQVVVTHLPPWHDAAEIMAEVGPEYDGPVAQARPGDVYEL